MGMMLQQILRSLCDKTGWCYAVFWKLQRRDRMMLTWEDGYCEFAKPSTISRCAVMMSDSFLSMLDMGENSCNIIVSGQDCSCLEDKIGLAVAKMSYQVFSLGEGIIGHVAFTGKRKWIYGEDFTSITNTIGTVNRQSMLEAGWQNQFAAGIKTIAAIAVVPHGVVQLGSTHLVLKEGSLLGKGNLNSGASWALDLDGQTVWCPIIVENLNQPRQMLVEILCEERGVFLEIADIIQRLGLTILKGVMEAQNVKIWAHFVVEANRDVHRMEILWSLTHLLQQHGVAETHKSGVVEPHGIDSSPQALASMQKYPISTHHIPEGWQ